jgi:hypothetical protein
MWRPPCASVRVAAAPPVAAPPRCAARRARCVRPCTASGGSSDDASGTPAAAEASAAAGAAAAGGPAAGAAAAGGLPGWEPGGGAPPGQQQAQPQPRRARNPAACPSCEGTGRIPCKECDGSGRLMRGGYQKRNRVDLTRVLGAPRGAAARAPGARRGPPAPCRPNSPQRRQFNHRGAPSRNRFHRLKVDGDGDDPGLAPLPSHPGGRAVGFQPGLTKFDPACSLRISAGFTASARGAPKCAASEAQAV